MKNPPGSHRIAEYFRKQDQRDQEQDAIALDAINHLGHISVVKHPALGFIVGSKNVTIAALQRLCASGVLEAGEFSASDGERFIWLAYAGRLRLPHWATTRHDLSWSLQ